MIDPAYNDLVSRAFHEEVIPFEDITGDGIPDLVISEHVQQGNRYTAFVIRVLSLNKNIVTEYDPIDGRGEVAYFSDFDEDGILEFVNTDLERDFIYNEDNVPLSEYVWVLDQKQKQYIQTSPRIQDSGTKE